MATIAVSTWYIIFSYVGYIHRNTYGDGQGKIKIPPGTQRKNLRLRSKGFHINGYGRGDMIVNIQIWTLKN